MLLCDAPGGSFKVTGVINFNDERDPTAGQLRIHHMEAEEAGKKQAGSHPRRSSRRHSGSRRRRRGSSCSPGPEDGDKTEDRDERPRHRGSQRLSRHRRSSRSR